MALVKNQLIELTITGVTGEGSGVARYIDSDCPAPGMVVFVPFTAVGDTILCRIVKVQKTHAFGRVEELITPSADRQPVSDCAVYGKCGGCAWRHVTYEAECRYKWEWVRDTMQRVGGLSIQPLPLVGADTPDRYRNKAQYPVAPGPLVGFYAPRSHRLVPCTDCPLQPAGYADVLTAVTDWMKENDVSAYDEVTHTGLVRHIYIRQGAVTRQMMVCLVCTSGKLPAVPALIDKVKAAAPDLASLCVNVNPKQTNVILGDRGFTLWGADAIEDELCGLRFRLSPHSFFQVNHAQTEKLYTLAADAAGLTGDEVLLDLYCGTGTIGLSMAHKAGQVIGVEVVPAAVEDAYRNAKENGIDNARFLCADAAQAAVQLEREGICPDVVILDPPRKGCDEELLKTVARMAPRRVVYVSCDPATLARDLARFAPLGYVTNRVQPVDLFPRTHHCETVALLSRQIVVHKMKLNSAPFEMIKSGEKTIELRLFDEKRQQLKVGDKIVFTDTTTGETLNTTVVKLHRFDSFEELYKSLPLLKCGYTTENVDNANSSDMEEYYSVEEQRKHGVVGIELCRPKHITDENVALLEKE